MNIVVCPFQIFQRLLRALAENPQTVLFVRVGTQPVLPDRIWLVRDFSQALPPASGSQQELFFRLTLTPNLPSGPIILSDLDPLPPAVVGTLSMGTGSWHSHLWGVIQTGEGTEPLHQLFLVGPGMHRIQIPTSDDREPTPPPPSLHPTSSLTRWSRTMGGLGGEAIWQRLSRLRVGLIGCGRSGSLVAVTLARLGLCQLSLIDPDRVERHNLGEMDGVTEVDLGRPKAEVISEHLSSLLSPFPVSVSPIVAPITDPAALTAAKSCDVLFCCADNDAARLATAILATLYHKVLVDIGTGIFQRPVAGAGRESEVQRQGRIPAISPVTPLPVAASPLRTMGADIRLILPGDGCLLCWGNLTNYNQAVDELCNHHSLANLQQRQRDWRQQRAGSLRSLNQLAVGLGIQMLQDLVAERLQASTWAQMEFNAVGHLAVHYPSRQLAAGQSPCALCAKAGLGEVGLGWSR